ncbi:TetR family transcriptional regulator [Alphaproteobacteria bacterium]|nr:TetR family transcriptional regulator [Alphaproteobacteria bacterium]
MIKRSVGRPKLLSREHVINTAFSEYWLHGINNVPISKIALLAGVSRPGIYIEFTNEDELQCEALKKYLYESVVPVYKNYDNYKNFPNHLLNHLDAVINNGNDYLSDNNLYRNSRPKGALGCLLIKSSLNPKELGPITLKTIKDFDKYRVKQLKIYASNAQNAAILNKNIDIDFFARYSIEIFKLAQLMRLDNSSASYIKKVVNTSLEPFFNKKEMLH